MTKIKKKDGRVLFSFDEGVTTLAKEIGRYKELRWATLSGADLSGADLGGANLRTANLQGADLSDADLSDADLRGANLEGANLQGANLKGADLSGVDLRYANLENADLSNASLLYTNLFGANLQGANTYKSEFYGADLVGASGVPDLPIACPSEGSFVAWKKVRNFLVKLKIPEDAKRSSATSNKCRCDKALVLDIVNINNGEHQKKVVNENFCKCVYEVGKMVFPDWFDEDRWNECSHGIHFFMDKQDAVYF